MKMEKEPKYVDGTLAWCNRIRKKYGKRPLKKLPKGTRGDGYSCPCGKATGMWVGSVDYHNSDLNSRLVFRPLPKCVQQFVPDFDAGKLPQYEKKET